MIGSNVVRAISVLGICGSLRKASLNALLLEAAARLAPEGLTIEKYDRLRDIPPFDQDDEDNMPEPVRDLHERMNAADALLFVTPEFNYGVPGVLKNAIDWATRPYESTVLTRKPIAIMGGSPSSLGSVRAQLALRQSFLWTNSDVLLKPEVMIPRLHDRFDEEGDLRDEDVTALLRQQLIAFKNHIAIGRCS